MIKIREIKLNQDGSLNILIEPENKTYVMCCHINISTPTYPVYYLLVKSDNIYGFNAYFKITEENKIDTSIASMVITDKYIQYSIYRALDINNERHSTIKVSIFEFDSEQEFIEWYKNQPKVI